MSRWKQALFGALSIDLLLRAIAELLGEGSAAAVSAGAGLLSRYLFDLSTVVWVYGWLLLWMVVFQLTPVLFPRQAGPDWTEGIANRALVATGSVAVGLTLEGWLAWVEGPVLETDVFTARLLVQPIEAGALLVGILLGYAGVRWLGRTPLDRLAADRSLLYRPTTRPDPTGITADRYLLAVVVLGTVLASVALLFPLPELVVVGLQLADFLLVLGAVAVGGGAYVSAREDVVKGLVGATLAVWGELEDLFQVAYVLAPLAWIAVVAAAVIKAVDFGTVLARQPAGLAVLVACLAVGGGYTVIYEFRMCERLRARRLGDADGADPLDPPRVPLFLLPAGLLFAAVALLLTGQGDSAVRGGITAVDTAPGAVAVAAAGSVLAVGTVRKPSAFTVSALDGAVRDYGAAAIATATLVCTFFLGVTIGNGGLILSNLVSFPFLFVTVASLYVGPRLCLGPPNLSERDRLVGGSIVMTVVVVVGIVVVGIASAVVDLDAGVPGPVGTAVLGVAATLMVGGVLNLGAYLFFLPFHLRRSESES